MRFISVSRHIAAVLAALALVSPAAAQTSSSGTFKTGAQLLDACSSSDEIELAKCDWYIMGVHDAIILHQDLELIDEEMCLSEGTQIEDLRKVVLDYLR